MYSITATGINKKLETWQLIIPLNDNFGNKFTQTQIDEVLENIALTFPGYTVVSCMGFWKDQKQTYKDENYQVLIDTLSSDSDETTAFFSNLKDDLCKTLGQEKIYVTKTANKEELISFKEFFSELGLEVQYKIGDDEANQKLAQQIVTSQEFVFKRLAYETLVLQRNPETKKIIWERKICGIRLRSEFDDNLPEEIILCGADQINELGNAIFGDKDIVIIGDYEYQKYILEKISYRPLVETKSENFNNETAFVDREGNTINTKKFIELFSMSVFNNYVVLREENFTSKEIRINVGKDGSLQIGENKVNGNYLLSCPAIINDANVQQEIIRCLEEAMIKFESNQLDTIALLQTKARNYFIKKRAILRKAITLKKSGG
jgi:hypothetical protein